MFAVGWDFDGKDYEILNDANGDANFFNAYGDAIVKTGSSGVVLLHCTTSGSGGKVAGLTNTLQYLKDNGYK